MAVNREIEYLSYMDRPSLPVIVYFAAAAAACSSNGGMLFGSSGGYTGSSGNGGSSGTSGQSGQGGTSVASSSSEAQSSVSSSEASSSAVTVVASSSSTGGGGNLIECGMSKCNLMAGQSCCWDKYAYYPPPQAKCVTGDIYSDDCQTMQTGWGAATRIECQGPANCGASELCCARRKTFYDNNMQYPLYDQLTCQKSCNFPDIVVCDKNTVCPMLPKQMGGGFVQGVCQQSSLLPKGYTVCGYP